MVVIALPAAAATGVMQDRRGAPSRCTVQAPHCAIPQPNFVPVRPTSSRRTHSRGMSGGASTSRSTPLIASFTALFHRGRRIAESPRMSSAFGTMRPTHYSYRSNAREASMELRHLRYFVGVGEEQHFGRGAQRLHIAQPALSRQIQDLEHELGFLLFDRLPRGVRLNEAGKLFFIDARRILQDVD